MLSPPHSPTVTFLAVSVPVPLQDCQLQTRKPRPQWLGCDLRSGSNRPHVPGTAPFPGFLYSASCVDAFYPQGKSKVPVTGQGVTGTGSRFKAPSWGSSIKKDFPEKSKICLTCEWPTHKLVPNPALFKEKGWGSPKSSRQGSLLASPLFPRVAAAEAGPLGPCSPFPRSSVPQLRAPKDTVRLGGVQPPGGALSQKLLPSVSKGGPALLWGPGLHTPHMSVAEGGNCNQSQHVCLSNFLILHILC